MACCVLVAFLLSRVIRSCESLDILKVTTAGSLGQETVTAEPTSQHAVTKILITGMSCSACCVQIEHAIGQLDGVSRVTVALPFNQATVAYNQSKISLESIIQVIEELGYEAEAGKQTAQDSYNTLQHHEELSRLQQSFSGVLTCSSFLILTNMLAGYGFLDISTTQSSMLQWTIPLIELGLTITIHHRHASWIHRNACKSLRTGHLTMDTLTSTTQALGLLSSLSNLALLGPSATTHLTTTALLLLVVLFGRTVDLLLRRDATSTLTSLFRLQSELAHVRLATTNEDHEAGTPSFLPAALLAPGDEILVPAFSTVPCDCYLLSPTPTSLDLSTLTGEPTPVAKGPGDPVLAGAREAAGRHFVAVVAKPHADSALARILDGVVEAAGRKTLVEEGVVGGMVRRFVAVVLGVAGASAAVEFWGAGGGGGVVGAANAGVQRAMAVVAAACPCALGLAVPAAAMSFLGTRSSFRGEVGVRCGMLC